MPMERRSTPSCRCQIFFVLTTLIMGLYTIARWLTGKLDSVRRTTFDNTMLFWYYTVGQGLVGIAGGPRLPAADRRRLTMTARRTRAGL